ncbi:hypothetical protein LP420_38655 [Massilia sp. B-10]|nr:hypothetical protein LP420_38655 [Massilia sp. B-10]
MPHAAPPAQLLRAALAAQLEWDRDLDAGSASLLRASFTQVLECRIGSHSGLAGARFQRRDLVTERAQLAVVLLRARWRRPR